MLKEIPQSKWPANRPIGINRMFVTDAFGIQEYKEADGRVRLTVHRLKHKNGKWLDGITWDELQHVKRLVGYADKWAVEIYPPDKSIVNVANMRHLWLIDQPDFGWKRCE